jgi:hypothetical protein
VVPLGAGHVMADEARQPGLPRNSALISRYLYQTVIVGKDFHRPAAHSNPVALGVSQAGWVLMLVSTPVRGDERPRWTAGQLSGVTSSTEMSSRVRSARTLARDVELRFGGDGLGGHRRAGRPTGTGCAPDRSVG